MEPKIIRKIGVAFFIFLITGFVYMYLNSPPSKSQSAQVNPSNQQNKQVEAIPKNQDNFSVKTAQAKSQPSSNSSGINDIQYVTNKVRNKNYKTFTVQTTYYLVEITSKGAEIKSFKHLDKKQKLKDKTELTLEEPFMFQIFSNAMKDFSTIRNANFKIQVNQKANDITQVHASENFTAHSANKTYPVKIHKYFTFYKDLHYWKFSYRIENLSSSILNFPYVIFESNRKIGPKNDSTSSRAAQGYYSFIHSDGDLTTLSKVGGAMGCGHSSDLDAGTAPIDFIGKASRFMLLAVQPLYPTVKAYYFNKGKESKEADELQVQLKPIMLQGKKSQAVDFLVYTGPKVKDYVKLSSDQLNKHPEFKSLHEDFYKAFDFGMTAPIRDLIVFFLEMLYKLVPNYGIGIILFAILFKLVFFPLNQKQADSMKKMQKLQPQMKEINEKFKKNPQEKQKRTMALYKQHKVNPLSGCLPLVIQIPIFIALYSAFSDSYELWKSPFIMGWINDLSEPDTVMTLKNLPFVGTFNVNILPIFMTASQFLQTKLTTVSGGGDSSQQKIMQFMPLIMLFFFWSMPAGVVLYWTIQNVLSIAQQVWTNKKDAKA